MAIEFKSRHSDQKERKPLTGLVSGFPFVHAGLLTFFVFRKLRVFATFRARELLPWCKKGDEKGDGIFQNSLDNSFFAWYSNIRKNEGGVKK